MKLKLTKNLLSEYILVLDEAFENDHCADDRLALTKLTAEAGKMLALLHKHEDFSVIEELATSENRTHSQIFLVGPSHKLIMDSWLKFYEAL